MESKRRPRRHFDDQFRLSVLKEFYSSGKLRDRLSAA